MKPKREFHISDKTDCKMTGHFLPLLPFLNVIHADKHCVLYVAFRQNVKFKNKHFKPQIEMNF